MLERHIGPKLPADVKIFIHEEDANTLHFSLPPPAPSNAAELSDEDLERVAGGTEVIVVMTSTIALAATAGVVAINLGEIVWNSTDAMGTMHGFVYSSGVFYAVADPGGAPGSTVINGVNDLGQLVGFYADANDNVIGFVATPTPEPGPSHSWPREC